MLLTDFDYHLPTQLIAQEPAVPRDSARLMLINRGSGEISHHLVADLPQLLPKDYFVVANNTKVFPARLLGHKSSGGKIEVLLTSPLGHSRYHCITRGSLKLGDTVLFPTGLTGTIASIKDIERTIEFDQEESELRTTLSQIGTMPTPPYIKKLLGNSADYQTIYAKYGFSAAAPTAGLHFTRDLLKQIKLHHKWHEITLNVGLGTFLPVKEERVEDHHMHAESYTISPTTSESIAHLKASGQKLLSIGTTTMRALESSTTTTDGHPELVSGSNSTSIFIYPPYQFGITDALMTNFHLPKSTLLMLVSAFCSSPNSSEKFTRFQDSLLGRAYTEAIRLNYRFFSFGDAMLII